MLAEKLRIRLDKKKDADGKIYYLAKVKFPGTLDFKDGAVFLIFTSEEGEEEMQIGNLHNGPMPSGKNK